MIWADAVILGIFFVGHEAFAAFAIPSLIFTFINMIAELLPNQLAATLVVFVGRTHEIRILDAERMNEILKLLCVLVNKILDRHTAIDGFLIDLAAVLIGASL